MSGQQFSDDDYTAVQRHPDDPFAARVGEGKFRVILVSGDGRPARWMVTGRPEEFDVNLAAHALADRLNVRAGDRR